MIARRHRLRDLLVAVAALALTAGVASAARPASAPPDAAAEGLERATEAAGKRVPAVVEQAAPAPEEPEAVDDGEAAPDAEDPADDADRPVNHGWYVSQAAKAETPDGYDNHGAWVSSVARGDDGKPETAGAGAAGKAKGAAAKEAAAERKAERKAGGN